METQHLNYFKVENFKRFDSFEMSNLGQFNLIVGDNNVGKTSVLEALTFDEELSVLVEKQWTLFTFRNIFDVPENITSSQAKDTQFWQYIFRDTNKPLIIKGNNTLDIKLEIINTSNLSEKDKLIADRELKSTLPNEWIKQTSKDSSGNEKTKLQGAYFETISQVLNDYVPFIPTNLANDHDLTNFFYKSFNGDKVARKELENNLRFFIPNLEEIRTHRFINNQDTLSVTLTDKNSIYSIGSYGDGTVKLTRLLIEIIMAKNQRLMVDEIGSGIHFTRLKDYWKTILQLCIKYNVQLFATTHSLECQRAFVDALDDSDMQQYQKDARNITLLENKQGNVKAVTYDFEQFEYALTIGFNTRGGSR